MRRITMTRLAELAGVDVSTVSRALSGDRSRVAAATRARIQELADRHGFRPDPLAAALRTGQSKVLGVLVNSMADGVIARMLDGIADQAAAHGYLAVTTPTRSVRRLRAQAAVNLVDRRVDGVIVADTVLRSSLPRVLVDAGTPCVLALRPSGDRLGVFADDVRGGRLVADHLLDRGHRDVLVVSGPANVATSRARIGGFRQGLRLRGVRLADEQVISSGWDVRDGHDSMRRALDRGQRPTAVFAFNDHSAIGVSRALQDRGLEVGVDVAVVGYNDMPIAAEVATPLSSVRIDMELMGRLAVDTLLAAIAGTDPVTVTLPPRLMVRASSDFPAP